MATVSENNEIAPYGSAGATGDCIKCGAPARKASITAWIMRKGQPACLCNIEHASEKAAQDNSPFNSVEFQKQDVKLESQIINDRYLLCEVIGKGGMGTVYKARHLHLDRFFAIKMLKQDLITNESTYKRFAREAKATSRLTHPNLVSVYDFGVTDSGIPYYVMELVEGTSLESVIIKEVALTTQRALKIFSQVASAIARAHAGKVIHRDIKPSNILLSQDEKSNEFVKVVDFGIAKILCDRQAEATKVTETGAFLGSPHYMSPEHCSGEDTDERSDIYSLGCVMYEMLTGQPPFSGSNNMMVLMKHIKQDPAELKNKLVELGIPHPIEAIVMRCLEKLPEDRYETAEALRVDIESARSGLSIKEKGKKSLSHLGKLKRRLRQAAGQKWQKAMIALVVIAVSTSATLGLVFKENKNSASLEALWSQYDRQGQEEFNRGNLLGARNWFEKALVTARNESSDKRLYLSSLEELLDLSRAENNPPETAKLALKIESVKRQQEQNSTQIERELKSQLDKSKESAPQIDEQRLRNLLNNANDVAASQIESGHYDNADRILLSSKALCEKRLGDTDQIMCRCLHNIAYNLHSQGKYAEASRIYRQALAVEERVFAGRPDALQAMTLQNYGRLCLQTGVPADVAEKTLQRSLDTFKALFGPQSQQVAWVRYNLAGLYFRQGRKEDAKLELKTALTIYDSLDQPAAAREARCYHLLGLIDQDQNALQRALERYQSAVNKDYSYLLENIESIAVLDETKSTMTIPLLVRALSIAERLGVGDREREKAKLLTKLGEFQRRQNNLKEAEQSFSQALKLKQSLFGDNSWEELEALGDLAILHADWGKKEISRKYFNHCISILQRRQDTARAPDFVRKLIFRYRLFLKSDEPNLSQEALMKKIPVQWR